MKKFFLILAVFAMIFSSQVFAEDNENKEPEPYEKTEFPSWLLNLRRTEIVTLGSVPFTTLAVSLTYSTFQYATGRTSSFPSPFNKNANYSQDDIKMIVGFSLGISFVIGIVDLVINLLKQKNQKKIQQKILQESNTITIIPTVEYVPGGQPPTDSEQLQDTEEK